MKKITYEQADEFFLHHSDPNEWKPKEFINYFHLLQTTYLGYTFRPLYSKRVMIAMGQFLKSETKIGTKRVIEGLFLFRDELAKNEFYRKILSTFRLEYLTMSFASTLIAASAELMVSREQFLRLPSWKRKPQSEWSYKDWQEFRLSIKGGAHGEKVSI